jgi:ADP-ribose pyrophosphatase YjhB (NUDIX family)
MDIACVGAIVRDELGRILVIRRGNPPGEHLWSIPGGRVEVGESDRDAVRREVGEETGLRVIVDGVAGEVMLAAPDIADRYLVRDYFAHLEGAEAAEPVAGDDASDARWATRTELLALDLTPNLAETLALWNIWQ